MSTEKIVLKNDKTELARLSEFLAVFAERHRVPQDLILKVNLALEELLVNTISYGYDGPGEHDISVELHCEPHQLDVRIEDDGRPFNPLDAPEPDVNQPLEKRPLGGLGIFLVKQMADAIRYRRSGDKNVVTLVKNF